jgi:hypothetical protein
MAKPCKLYSQENLKMTKITTGIELCKIKNVRPEAVKKKNAIEYNTKKLKKGSEKTMLD